MCHHTYSRIRNSSFNSAITIQHAFNPSKSSPHHNSFLQTPPPLIRIAALPHSISRAYIPGEIIFSRSATLLGSHPPASALPPFCSRYPWIRFSISGRKWRMRPCTGQAAASPRAQIVWPSISLVSSQSWSISRGRASPCKSAVCIKSGRAIGMGNGEKGLWGG